MCERYYTPVKRILSEKTKEYYIIIKNLLLSKYASAKRALLCHLSEYVKNCHDPRRSLCLSSSSWSALTCTFSSGLAMLSAHCRPLGASSRHSSAHSITGIIIRRAAELPWARTSPRRVTWIWDHITVAAKGSSQQTRLCSLAISQRWIHG